MLASCLVDMPAEFHGQIRLKHPLGISGAWLYAINWDVTFTVEDSLTWT
jgi:hypothetical protein